MKCLCGGLSCEIYNHLGDRPLPCQWGSLKTGLILMRRPTWNVHDIIPWAVVLGRLEQLTISRASTFISASRLRRQCDQLPHVPATMSSFPTMKDCVLKLRARANPSFLLRLLSDMFSQQGDKQLTQTSRLTPWGLVFQDGGTILYCTNSNYS